MTLPEFARFCAIPQLTQGIMRMEASLGQPQMVQQGQFVGQPQMQMQMQYSTGNTMI